MAQDKETKGKWKRLLEQKKWTNAVLILGLCGMLLLAVSGLFSKEDAQTEAASDTEVTAETYAETLEEKLCEMVNAITGQDGAQVMVTMERGSELVYATEEKKSTDTEGENRSDDTEKSYILVKSADGSQTALAVTELEPVVKGVVVVCPRGDELLIKQSVVEALTTALHISSARVCVLHAN